MLQTVVDGGKEMAKRFLAGKVSPLPAGCSAPAMPLAAGAELQGQWVQVCAACLLTPILF